MKSKPSKLVGPGAPSPSGTPGRLPVPSLNAKPRLAGRGGEKTVATVADFGKKLRDLPKLAAHLTRINAQKADLDVQAGVLRETIKELMASVKADESWTVRSEDTEWVATYIVPKETKKLVPELLVLAGVTKQQLAKGYKTVPAKNPYVQVRTKNDDSDSGEEE